MKKVLLIVLAVILVGGLILSGCAKPTPTPAPAPTPTPTLKAKPEGTLVVAVSTLADEGFLPDIGAGIGNYADTVYEWLIFLKCTVNRDPIPGLAEKWEYSNNYQDLTFWIRKGVLWQGGWGEVTAEDVKYSMERIMREGATSASTGDFRKRVKGITVVDPYQVVFHFNKPDPTFWKWMSDGMNGPCPIVCKKYIETVGDDKASQEPIGSGPYRLVEHKLGEYLKFEAVDEHWRIVPEFKYLILRIIPEESTQIAMLKTREIDAMMVSPSRVIELEAAGFKVVNWPGGYVANIVFNGLLDPTDKRYDPTIHQKDPWKDKRVREAMNIAIDREAIVKSLYFGTASPATMTMMSPGFDKLEPYPYEPERARQLLAEAGFPNGFSTKVYSSKWQPGAEIPTVVEAIAGYWEAIGIKTEIIVGDWTSIRSAVQSGKLQGLYSHRTGYFDDWDQQAMKFYHPTGDTTKLTSPELTALMDKIVAELDPQKKDALWRELANYLHDNYESVSWAIAHQAWAYGPEVGDWPANYAVRPWNLAYVRHAKPLNTYRLFELD